MLIDVLFEHSLKSFIDESVKVINTPNYVYKFIDCRCRFSSLIVRLGHVPTTILLTFTTCSYKQEYKVPTGAVYNAKRLKLMVNR